MSSSSSSPSPSPLQQRASDLPTPPISPLVLAAGDSITSPKLDPIIEHVRADHTLPLNTRLTQHSRAPSGSSISFKSNGRSTPTGSLKAKPPSRVKQASPPPAARFQHHVSFDNFAGGEPTEKNSNSFTLNVKHKGYQFRRRSRVFMVGIDENDYSDIALQWMLEELVDDGDQIICLRVVDKDAKVVSDRNIERRQYQKEANVLMKRIQSRNDENKAISIVVEYVVGKVHAEFQKMIQLYEPAMLIVGTRGRSLGGLQGLMTNRNSFSKWCLQYSPIPVVVVRPTEKRMKKKKKRDADPARQDYARILKESGIEEHETEHSVKNDVLEASNDPDAEAHAVAAALGLPARFDPTLKPFDEPRHSKKGKNAVIPHMPNEPSPGGSRSTSPTTPRKNSKLSEQLEVPALSGGEESSEGDEDEEDEEDEDEEEGEFEAVPGHTLLGLDAEEQLQKKQKLHVLEMQEAAALAAGRKGSTGSGDTGSSGSGTGVGPPDEAEDGDDEVKNEG